jgi:hypothetical protein
MKKIGVFVTLVLLLFYMTSFVVAAEGDECSVDADCDEKEVCQSEECVLEDDSTKDAEDKIADGFTCLEEKVDDCSKLNVQELALTILATPDNVFDECVDELNDRKSSDHWGNVRDTALAILALQHAGENTDKAEEWLLEQEMSPSGLTWYLQEDSNNETKCNIAYDGKDYDVIIGEDKKIDASSTGSCLSRAQSDFWLKIDSNCYGEVFRIKCDEDFIANLLYRNQNSNTIYVLEGTQSSPALGFIDLEIKSKCFGESSCDYEGTAWATLALLDTDHKVEEYIPYLIAMSETNEKYLPNAFIYALTNYDDYANQLISNQKLGNYWKAGSDKESSAYNEYYDTALALISLGSSSSEQIENAREWLVEDGRQGSNGCWNNQIRDTAMVLWALEGRAGRISGGDSGGDGVSVTTCAEGNFFCIPTSECPTSEIRSNYFCSSLSATCCATENLKTCSNMSGKVCEEGTFCTGNSRKSLDVEKCCTGSCEEKLQQTECEENFYGCYDSCSDNQEKMSYSCNGEEVCCRTKPSTGGDVAPTSSAWWIWVLVVLIFAVLVAIGYVYREQLQMLWFQIKSKFKKDDGKGNTNGGPRFPPRPGFPPVRRMRPIVAPTTQVGPPVRTAPVKTQAPIQNRSYDKRDKAMSDTFKKLREMSG